MNWRTLAIRAQLLFLLQSQQSLPVRLLRPGFSTGRSPWMELNSGTRSTRRANVARHNFQLGIESQGFRTALRLVSRSFVTFSTLSASTPTSFSASRKWLRNLSKCPSFNPCSRAWACAAWISLPVYTTRPPRSIEINMLCRAASCSISVVLKKGRRASSA